MQKVFARNLRKSCTELLDEHLFLLYNIDTEGVNNMAVTIKDVAALAGVSPSTVSRVCNDNPSISKETRERVRKAMAQLGYELNPAPAPMQESRAIRMVGIILPASQRETYDNSFYLEAIRGVSKYCNMHGAASMIITGRDDREVLSALENVRSGGQADGFILLYSKRNDPVVEYLVEHGLLYVLIGKPSQNETPTICIDNDNLLAGREAADYLYDLGHRRMAYLSSGDTYLFSADRKSGFQLSMLQHGLAIREEDCVELEGLREDSADKLRALLEREDRPTAVVVSDDLLAVALERVCVQMGLSIPDDLSIISFNNSLLAQLTTPQLTSVDVNSLQLGYEAASQIANHADNPNLMASKIIVPHRIVVRGSCKAI